MSYKQTGYSSNFGYIPYTSLSGNSGSGGSGVTNLNGLTDVTLSGISDNQVLRYDNASSKWVNEDDVSASNVGAGGVGLFYQRNGNDFEFKNINAGSNKITLFDDDSDGEVEIDVDETNLTLENMIGAPNGTIIGSTDVQTLTNKTIDGDLNTITNIGDEELKAGINANKISSGVVSNTEFDYLNNVSSNIQTQLNGKSSTSHTHAVEDLSDVTVSGVSDGDILVYNSGAWANGANSKSLNDLTDASVSSSAVRDLLSYDGSNFSNMQPYLALGGDGTNSLVVGQASESAGTGDVVIGTNSHAYSSIGQQNTLVGNIHGCTGSYNTLIGYNHTVNGFDNTLLLGSEATADDDNQMVVSLNDGSSNYLKTKLDFTTVGDTDYLSCTNLNGTRYIPCEELTTRAFMTEGSVDIVNDHIRIYDDSAGESKNILVGNLPVHSTLDFATLGVDTTPDIDNDYVISYDDSAASTKKVAIGDLVNINNLSADASPDGAADYIMTYDASASAHKKVLIDNLPSSSSTQELYPASTGTAYDTNYTWKGNPVKMQRVTGTSRAANGVETIFSSANYDEIVKYEFKIDRSNGQVYRNHYYFSGSLQVYQYEDNGFIHYVAGAFCSQAYEYIIYYTEP